MLRRAGRVRRRDKERPNALQKSSGPATRATRREDERTRKGLRPGRDRHADKAVTGKHAAIEIAENITPDDGIILVTGSLYLIGEVKLILSTAQ